MTSLRRAEKSDVNEIQRISGVLTLDIPEFRWDQRDYIEQEIAKGNYYVLELEGKVVAIICICVESKTGFFGASKTGFINALAVEPAKQKSGLGKLLIEFAIGYAKENGATSLVRGVFSAVRFAGLLSKIRLQESRHQKVQFISLLRFQDVFVTLPGE